MAGRHHREPACHRLEHRVGNALDISACRFAWMKEYVRLEKEILQRILREESCEPDSIADSEPGGGPPQLFFQGPFAGDCERRFRMPAPKGCEGMQSSGNPLLRHQSRGLHDPPARYFQAARVERKKDPGPRCASGASWLPGIPNWRLLKQVVRSGMAQRSQARRVPRAPPSNLPRPWIPRHPSRERRPRWESNTGAGVGASESRRFQRTREAVSSSRAQSLRGCAKPPRSKLARDVRTAFPKHARETGCVIA